jgi:hypothetical protein
MSLLWRPERVDVPEGVEAARGTGTVPIPRAAPGTTVGADYLRRAGGHLRKSVVAFACVNQIMALPIAAAELFGRPVSGSLGLQPASDVVHGVLRQDRSLAAWTARDCLVLLDNLLRTMGGSWTDALDVAMSAAGLLPGPAIDPVRATFLPHRARCEVTRLANRVLAMFFAFDRADGRRGVERAFYERLFAARSMGAALVAHDIAAWTGVVIGRLRHAGYLDDMPWMRREFTTVPVMTTAGWYPNPFRMGEIYLYEATLQRYWDGTDWTDRIRVRGRHGWCERVKSMYEAPPN